jgi:hypothetical protein
VALALHTRSGVGLILRPVLGTRVPLAACMYCVCICVVLQ